LSSLTKVFAVLVSVLAIFLCGVVVTFVTNTENWKESYLLQKTETDAARVQAMTAQEALSRGLALRDTLIQRLNDNIAALENRISELARDKYTEAQFRGDAEKRADDAVALAKALQGSNESYRVAQDALNERLRQLEQTTLTAQAQVIDLERELNGLQVKNDRLEAIRRDLEEKRHELENENARIRQELEQVTLASSEFRASDDQVALAPAAAGVPIRGQILEIRDDTASISVGSS